MTESTYSWRLVAHVADAGLNVVALLLAYVGVLGWSLKAQPEPEDVPNETNCAVEVEGSLPAEMGG